MAIAIRETVAACLTGVGLGVTINYDGLWFLATISKPPWVTNSKGPHD